MGQVDLLQQRSARPAEAIKINGAYEGFWLAALTDTVFVPASRRCTIAINPKAACSTLKVNVWRQDFELGATPYPAPTGKGGIHRKERTTFTKASVEDLEAALFERPVFSIVRNPYTRLLSAYLDKIAIELKRPKRQLLVQMGRSEDASITFPEFVDFICAQNSREMNVHYAPQAFLMQVHYHPFNHIGCVEAMEESLSTIIDAAYGVKLETKKDFRPHRTDASALIAEHFTDEITAKVLRRFRGDFDIFGYDYDIAKAHLPPQNLKFASRAGSELSESLLRPAIRAAVAEKNRDYSGALALLSSVECDEPELDVTRARLLTKLNRKEEALFLLQSVTDRVDSVARYWILLSECLLALRRTKQAAETADRAVAIAPHPGIMRSAMRSWRKAGAKSEKLAAYKTKIASAEVLESPDNNSILARLRRLFD